MKHSNLNKVLCTILAGILIVCCALVNVNATVIKRGDVDGNGSVTPADARLALRAAANLERLDETANIAANVDDVGTVTPADARKILRVSANLEKFENPEIIIEDETDVQEPTTEEPTTEVPTTEEPTTEEPTTEEPTTEEPTTSVPAVDDKGRTIVTEYPAVIDSLFNKSFYLKCESEMNGVTTPMVFAMNGNKIEVLTELDGETTSVLIEKKKNWLGINVTTIYMKMIFDGKPSYFEFSESLIKLIDPELDINTLTEAFDFGTTDDYEYTVCYTDTVEGAEYTVYGFVSKNGAELCFCFDTEGNVKYMLTKNPAGNVMEKYNVDVLSGTIPSDVLTLNGYKKIDISSMIGDMMK